MSSERTPLLQSVPVADHHDRYPHRRVRRICTAVLTAILVASLTAVIVYLAVAGYNGHDHRPQLLIHDSAESIPHRSWPESEGISYGKLRRILARVPSGAKAREWSEYYTAGPHLAGKNLSQAEWTQDRWREFGVPHTEIVAYDVYLNYPLDHRLAMLEHGVVAYEASVEEDVLDEDPTTSLPDRVPVFHGYSANGNVTASFVFCNYGTYDDFEDLRRAGVSLEGKIALVKYGFIFRGLKIKRASELGMIGVVIYSDPGDDGEMTEENGHKPYPDGPARHPKSVQRGSAQYISILPGDPTTPGYPSKPGAPRQPVDGKIPDIPSLPVSYADALPLLKALNGHGPNASDFPASWHTGGLGYKGVNYNIGPTPSSTTINLMNRQEYVTTPLWNVIGVINGTIEDEVVVIGNHRDAWVAGGAVDPNSGSAALNEVIRAFGQALAAGWKPLRTIVFASWDGEEYGLLGSTEWVEEFVPWLATTTVAYINVDIGAGGRHFRTSAAPLLNKAIYEIASEVQSPNQTILFQTVGDLWDGKISTIGSGSDFTAFQDFAGIPSVDLAFAEGPGDPVYHYHSNYDSFHWMDNFCDPGFEYHATIAQVIGLLAAKLVEEPILQFNATDYALGLKRYLQRVKDGAKDSGMGQKELADPFDQLDTAIDAFLRASIEFDAKAARLTAQLKDLHESSRARPSLYKDARGLNNKYKFLERQFLYSPGLDNRDWFKHVVFAPGRWTGYAGATFPGLVEALSDRDGLAAKRWAEIIAERIDDATTLLSGE